MNSSYILFDIGGTKMRFAKSRDTESLEPAIIVDTPQNYSDALTAISLLSSTLIKTSTLNLVMGGVPGVVDKKKGVLISAPHLKDWVGKPLASDLERIFSCRVLLENDTALVGLGEAKKGAGRNFDIVAYITVSTGVNGVRIVNGKIDKSTYGFEIGHQIIDFDARENYSDFGKGELEDFISGYAIQTRNNKLSLEVNDEGVWDNVAKMLAIGINNTIVYWSPQVVVIGGSVSAKISLSRVKQFLSEILVSYPTLPELLPASLGAVGGLWGALYSAIDEHKV